LPTNHEADELIDLEEIENDGVEDDEYHIISQGKEVDP
jgi:hypothetical protein